MNSKTHITISISLLIFYFIFFHACEITYSDKVKIHEIKYNGLLWVGLDHHSIRKHNSCDKPRKWFDYKCTEKQ